MKQLLYILLFSLLLTTIVNGQVCVGDSAKVTWKYFGDLLDTEIAELDVQENYPNRPSATKTLYKLQVPSNYDEYFGSLVEGFIRIPTTDAVTFNVTGNYRVQFFISPDETAENAVLVASTPNSTGTTEHEKYPEQTSSSITLQGGQFHYFKIKQIEGTSSDHAAIFWKTNHVDINNYNIITAAYLWDAACHPPVCPDRGIPCDDNNPSTTDDLQDGNCNCIGIPAKPNNCIGQRADLISYRYDTIPGSDIHDLYEAEDYPSIPDNGKKLNFLGQKRVSEYNSMGNLVQGYLTVPVTGGYKFNLTGDDGSIFYLSSDETPENKQNHFSLVTGWTYMNQYDKYVYQSTGFIPLEAGKYYYFEVNHKEGSGSEFFAVQWQTPFFETGVYKRIPTFYLYDYDCETACIPQGTLCDDGNIFTNNDQFDANCNCVGTPCSGPDCDDPLASYVPFDPCAVTNNLDNNVENNWLSCSIDENPNSLRDSGHWIMYDLGQRYELHKSHIWNYNVAGETSKGFKNVAIDYSDDGINWTEFGTYGWPLATGDSPYGGFIGPDFAGLNAQYILISNLDQGFECKGLGKVTIEAIYCPLIGTVCDDGNDNTILDHYNDNCLCVGVPFDANLCSEPYLVLGDSMLSTNNYNAEQYVNSISQIPSTSRVSMIAGNYVELNPGFETEGSTLFLAAIAECLEVPVNSGKGALKTAIRDELDKKREKAELDGLTVETIEGSSDQLITFYLKTPGQVTLALYDINNKLISTIIDAKFRNQGVFKKKLRTKRLTSGNIYVKFTTESQVETALMTVIPSTE